MNIDGTIFADNDVDYIELATRVLVGQCGLVQLSKLWVHVHLPDGKYQLVFL